MKRTLTSRATTARIIAYFNDNPEIFADCLEELDSLNGFLGDDRYESTDALNDLFCNAAPDEILFRAFYGKDADTDGAFNPNRDFFRFDGYGGLESTDYRDYSAYNTADTVAELLSNRRWVDSIDNGDHLAALFDELEAAEEQGGAEDEGA